LLFAACEPRGIGHHDTGGITEYDLVTLAEDEALLLMQEWALEYGQVLAPPSLSADPPELPFSPDLVGSQPAMAMEYLARVECGDFPERYDLDGDERAVLNVKDAERANPCHSTSDGVDLLQRLVSELSPELSLGAWSQCSGAHDEEARECLEWQVRQFLDQLVEQGVLQAP